MPGPETSVPDRLTDSHREASALRLVTHGTHTVASQKQLEGTRVLRKGDPQTQVTPPSLEMVAGGKHCASRSTITPTKTCSADLYRRMKRRANEHTAREDRSLPESKLHINYLELNAVFLALKEDLCLNKIVLIATDNTTVVAYINKEGGNEVRPLCAFMWRIQIWCSRKQVILKARHIPGRLNVTADKLRINNKLPKFVSPVPDPQAWAADSLSLSWEGLDPYAFPPVAILFIVMEKLQDYSYSRIILIAPGWPNMPWF